MSRTRGTTSCPMLGTGLPCHGPVSPQCAGCGDVQVESAPAVGSLPDPYYQDEAVTIYHGDCREILPSLPKVDLVLTDPPYGISQECGLTEVGMKRYGQVQFGDWDGSFPSWVLPLLPSTGAGSFYLFCPYQVLGELDKWADANSLQRRVLWWKKTNPTRRNGDVYWSIPGEHCFYAKRSGATFNAAYEVGFFESSNINRSNHPTEKPLPLIARLCIASTDPGDMVLDPFLGSGTTAVAAKKLNRKCIGIEIEERYCEIAANRCRQMVMELGL